ncbi:hypothetical protein [Nocardiopsis lambiniae]|uniref:Uncharacterized protein n=1 Tax=Nocardiopsis lambiniae TaxID=3075539 RepID=A0ABU2M338_9ACTN|nr:hypothetical protein [Nocardiopsis sp. DSM 44743]MDT0327059.1 hypothetical protein [Nocardiopsis sp. DSM 44743]
MSTRPRTVFEVRETETRNALWRWAHQLGVTIHHLGSDIEGREVYGAMLGPHLRVCRTAPERLHPARWVSPLEQLPRPRKAPPMLSCPKWCENDHTMEPSSDVAHHIRLLHDETGHPVTVYVEQDDEVTGQRGRPQVCVTTWVEPETVQLRLDAAQARALAVLLTAIRQDGDVASALTKAAELIDASLGA